MKNHLSILLFFFLLPPLASPSSHSQSSLSRGSSLSREDESNVLVSQNGAFTCGFYNVGSNAYTFSIWFSNSLNKTVAWTANRNKPVNGKGSRITFRNDGSLVLTDIDGSIVLFTNTNSTQADQLELLDSGNLVITDPNRKYLWQSFESPTDTLLPTQPITKNIKLVSSTAKGSLSSGYYSFFFDYNNILRLSYDGPEISSMYWPTCNVNLIWSYCRTPYNNTRYGVLDNMGHFSASDRFEFYASDMGAGIIRRLTLDYDGNLRLYSLNQSSGTWLTTWEALPVLCSVNGLCGKNGICLYTGSKAMCSCPPNYEMSDPSDWSKGCKPKFNLNCKESNLVRFVKLPQTDFWGSDLNSTFKISLNTCKKLCRDDCNCEGIHYMDGGDCFTKNALFNGINSPDTQGTIYIKVPKNVKILKGSMPQAHDMNCTFTRVDNTSSPYWYESSKGRRIWIYFYGFILVFGLVEILFVAAGWWFIFRKESNSTLAEEGYKLIASQFREFLFKELKSATHNFIEIIGTGGSGAVYKGILADKRVVAVKKLKDLIQAEEQFWAEVSIIGRIYHMNLVRMLGFCSDGPHKLLVSEFIENGSLDKHLFNEDSNSKVLGWKERFKIALGVAKGLAYLHHECLEWVVHCDIKPENILLGIDFEPKIADFGLSKLLNRGGAGSNISHVRGTRGYMAPEWASNLPITAKVDIFSYGVVLLEIVKGKRVSDWTTDNESDVCVQMKGVVWNLKERGEIEESWIHDFVDSRLGEFDSRQAKVMLGIAALCLEEDRNQRPDMDSIVEMLVAIET